MYSFKCILSLIIIGTCFFISFLIISIEVPTLNNDLLAPLSEKSWKRKTMEDCEVNRRRYFYVFNWTNINDYFMLNEKPEMHEIGPFVFKETRTLVNITWNKGYVSYGRKISWHFLQQESMGLDINITHVNPVWAIAFNRAKNVSNALVRREFDYLIEKDKINLSTTKTVQEFLFQEFVDRTFLPLKMPSVGEFGWFANNNNSIVKTFSFFTNGKIILNNTIPLFEPISDKLQFTMIEDSFCSNLTFNLSSPLLSEYSAYDTGLKCVNESYEKTILSSLPHFLDRQQNQIKGLSPSPKLHRPVIIYDQAIDVRLETNITQQLNIGITPVPWSETFLKNITFAEVPVLWFKDFSRQPDFIWTDIKSDGNENQMKVIFTSMAVIAFVFVALPVAFIVYKKFFASKFQPSLLADEILEETD